MQIYLSNVQLRLNEDRPPVNITSPGPVPIDLNIATMFITRGNDGVFHIIPLKPIATAVSSTSGKFHGQIRICNGFLLSI